MRALAALIAVACLACGPDFDRSIGLVSSPTILAVRAEPPESQPGATVIYAALAATVTGADANADIAWSFCSAPPATTEDSPASASCVAGETDATATGTVVSLSTPADACRRFGPLGMPTLAGAPPSRPAPPDASGGFHQPIRLGWHTTVSVVLERLTCDPTGVSLDLSQAYRAARAPNQNPRLLPLAAAIAGQPADLNALPPASVVDLVASWPPESVECYVTVDAERATLVWRDENVWVAWFVTGGSLDHDVSQAVVRETMAGNRFHAPASPGTLYLWTVLHDDRGGTDYAETTITVR